MKCSTDPDRRHHTGVQRISPRRLLSEESSSEPRTTTHVGRCMGPTPHKRCSQHPRLAHTHHTTTLRCRTRCLLHQHPKHTRTRTPPALTASATPCRRQAPGLLRAMDNGTGGATPARQTAPPSTRAHCDACTQPVTAPFPCPQHAHAAWNGRFAASLGRTKARV